MRLHKHESISFATCIEFALYFMSQSSSVAIAQRRNGRGLPRSTKFISRLIRYGKYKGQADTRSQRCLRSSCNLKPSPACHYCKALPFEPSHLRVECKPDNVLYRHLSSIDSIPWDRLIYSGRTGQYRMSSRIVACTSFRALPLFRAREQMNRFTSRLRFLDPMSVRPFGNENRSTVI